MERTNNALRTPFFFNENNESKKMATVSVAVISGAKFAQPNGVRLKYENVSFTLSVGDVAKNKLLQRVIILTLLLKLAKPLSSLSSCCISPLQIPVDIPLILGNLITIIFDYQILRKPLKTLSLQQVYFPLLFPLCYILPLAFMNLNMGKIKGKKIS